MEIESRVFLLAILKKKEDESINDVLMILEDAGVFTYKEGKKLLKELKKEGFVEEDTLTFKGIESAKDAELEFKL
jgi:predicted RNase H-like nuclease